MYLLILKSIIPHCALFHCYLPSTWICMWFYSLLPTHIICAFQLPSHYWESLRYIGFFYQMMYYFVKKQWCINNLYTQYVVLIQVKATQRNFPKDFSVVCCDDLSSSLPLVSLNSKHFSHGNGSCLEVWLFAFQKNLIDVPEGKDAGPNGIYLITC